MSLHDLSNVISNGITRISPISYYNFPLQIIRLGESQA